MALFSKQTAALEDQITLLTEQHKQVVASLDETREALEEATAAHSALIEEHAELQTAHDGLKAEAEEASLGAANQLEILISALAESGIDLTAIDLFPEAEESDEDEEAADPADLIAATVREAIARQAAVITASRGIEAPIVESDTTSRGPETQKQFWAQYNAIEDLGARNEFYQAHKATLKQLPKG